MMTARPLAIGLIAFSSLLLPAPESRAQEAQSASSSASLEFRPVSGELETKLDSKSARQGDAVVVKTTEPFKTASGVTLPKGTRIVGSVTEVQAKGAAGPDSHLGVRFDRAELKDGQSLAIQSSVLSVSRPPSAIAAGMPGDDSFGAAGGARATGSDRGGFTGTGPAGGSLTGAASAGTRSLDNAAGGAAASAQRGAAGLDPDAGLGPAAGTRTGSSMASNAAPHPSGIPGILLAGRAGSASSASGTFSAAKQNVHLDSGTQIGLAVALEVSH